MKAMVSITTVAVVILALVWKEKLFPYAILSLLVYSVTRGVDLHAARRKSWGLGVLVLAPMVVVSLSMMFGEVSEPWITALASTFDRYFSGFFFGIASTTERLAAAGYNERLIPIKGYAVLAFLVCTLAALKFLCEVSTLENMDPVKLMKSREESFNGFFIGIILLLSMLLLLVMGTDFYSPGCTRRCSNVHRWNFPFFQMLTLCFSLAFFFIGLFIAAVVGRTAPLPDIHNETSQRG